MMFGIRRNSQPSSLEWPNLHSLLEDDDRRAAVERLFPNEGRESFLKALRRVDPTAQANVLAAGRQLHTAAQLIDRPTVAVAGMLNSGKTSLVASFLSEQGRKRSLRGTNNSEGTHRFVLWLPSAWKQDLEVWGLLMSRFKDSLGQAPEMLDEDPIKSHAQYNNRNGSADNLSVPLVATDPKLDEVGIGLLDCPDIVSDAEIGLGSPEARRALLGRAATLCSAFLVVTGAESVRDATLGDLLRIAADLMPGVPRLLAVNKVRPRQTPDQVLQAFEPLAKSHGIESVYTAYDFDVPTSRPFIPRFDELGITAETDVDPMPVFFSLEKDPDQNPPAAIQPDRLLQALPSRLDRGQLFDKFRIALETGLRTAIWEEGYVKLVAHTSGASQATSRAQQMMLDAALEFFAHRDVGGEVLELRLHQSERIIRQLSESFAATAPWYARFSVRLHSTVRRFIDGASDFVKQLTPTAMARRAATDVRDKFTRGEYGGIVTPERLHSAIERFGGIQSMPHWKTINDWEAPCTEAMLRFERDDFTSLDPRRLDEAVKQMWTEVPMHKKLVAGLTPLAATLAAFGGVLMIPIDFGANALAAASISELLGAMGLAAMSAVWAGGQNSRNVGQQAARQQIADFQAVLCDVFGIARPVSPLEVRVAGTKQVLPTAQITSRGPTGPTLEVYAVRDEFQQELQRMIPRSGASRP